MCEEEFQKLWQDRNPLILIHHSDQSILGIREQKMNQLVLEDLLILIERERERERKEKDKKKVN